MRLLSLLLLSSCFAKEIVVPAPAPAEAKPQGEAGGIRVWANTLLWVGTPNDTESWVLPIGVDIENTTDQAVYFNLDDVRLVDDQGNKTAPFFMPNVIQPPPVNVKALRESMRANPAHNDMLMGADAKTSVFIREGGRAQSSGVQAWADETGMPTTPPTSWKEEVRFVAGPRVLGMRALTDRPIPARGRTHGFLYFPRAKSGAKKLTLEWKGAKVGFDVVAVK